MSVGGDHMLLQPACLWLPLVVSISGEGGHMGQQWLEKHTKAVPQRLVCGDGRVKGGGGGTGGSPACDPCGGEGGRVVLHGTRAWGRGDGG